MTTEDPMNEMGSPETMLRLLWGVRDPLGRPYLPSDSAIARCSVYGPRNAEDADRVLGSLAALQRLSEFWSVECPTLTLLARAALACAEESDSDPSFDLIESTRELLIRGHLLDCHRCRAVLATLEVDADLRGVLLDLPANRWELCWSQDEADAAFGDDQLLNEEESPSPVEHGWSVEVTPQAVRVTGPAAMDGASLVVVDPSRPVGAVRILTPRLDGSGLVARLPRDHGWDSESIEIHVHPGLGGVDLADDFELFDILRGLEATSRVGVRGTTTSGQASGGEVMAADDPITGVGFVVRRKPLRGKHPVELTGLTPGRTYRISLVWADRTESEVIEYSATSMAGRVEVLQSGGGQEPVWVRCR